VELFEVFWTSARLPVLVPRVRTVMVKSMIDSGE